MADYQTPGVYYQRMDASDPQIAAIRTDVAGFVGIALHGPLDTPVPIQSWRQFQAHFGGFSASGFLAYTVRAFFENGGRRCWVVRVASRDPAGGAKEAKITLKNSSGRDFWSIRASSPGGWGNNLSIILKETHRAQAVTQTEPKRSESNTSVVSSIAGFTRGTLVRLSQDAVQPVWKVVSDIDAINNRLVWVHANPKLKLPYDSPVEGFKTDRPILIESVEYTLAVKESGKLIALYEGLSTVPEHKNYGPQVLARLEISPVFKAPDTLPATPYRVIIEELRKDLPDILKPIRLPADLMLPLKGGTDGLALLQTYDFIGEAISPLDSDKIKEDKRRGIRALDPIAEVFAVAVPDIHIQPVSIPATSPLKPCVPDPCLPQERIPSEPSRNLAEIELPPKFTEDDIYRVQAALVQHCEERRDRIALLEPPITASRDDEFGVGAVQAWRSRFDSKYAVLYYPWLRVVDPLRPSIAITRDIPPSGHVAGQFARNDFEIGVHKAPANIPLVWVQDVTFAANGAVHGLLNPLGINAIRALPGQGIRIFGARTISNDPDWRYVNVRRLLMMIEKAIDLATQWAAFESNTIYTRTKLRLSLLSFLIALWQQGALTGSSVEEAFFVKCDEENNPARERDQGRLLAEVGVAPSKPFEFIVLKVGRKGNEFEISESPIFGGGGV